MNLYLGYFDIATTVENVKFNIEDQGVSVVGLEELQTSSKVTSCASKRKICKQCRVTILNFQRALLYDISLLEKNVMAHPFNQQFEYGS